MISDESVQTEGVKALLTVCKEGLIEREDAVFLTHNVLQILFRKADVMENAKVGALMMLDAFTQEGFFGKEVVESFVKEYLPKLMEDKMFKIKRPLL